MQKKYLIANWKMNLSLNEAEKLSQAIGAHAAQISNANLITILCPSFPWLYSVQQSIASYSPWLSLGAQDCSAYKNGAYTGEVCAQMIAEVGCKYVIVGHSERRILNHESSNLLIQKLEQAYINQLTPIYCIGETMGQKSIQEEILTRQIKDIPVSLLSQAIIAYEPVWAIGTGVTPEAPMIDVTLNLINDILTKHKVTSLPPLLYGGSVNSQNIEKFSTSTISAGFLVGGSSLQAEAFSALMTFMAKVNI